MKLLPTAVLGLVFSLPAFAVYAPIPEQEQGKALSASLRAGLDYDTNIFGASSDAISSWVYTVAPKLTYNQSVTDQLFVSAAYEMDLDYFENRPGTKTLFSHSLDGRAAYAFTPATSLDVSDSFHIDRNPAALLAGLPVNTDQSYQSNQLDARLKTAPTEKAGVIFKFRNIDYRYDNDVLASELDRVETRAGLEGNYALLPEFRLATEYWYQDIRYDTAGGDKDKKSNFFLAGGDYDLGKEISVGFRAGFEHRQRAGEPSVTAPYAELHGKWAYADRSFVSAGYVYSLQESSDIENYTDEKVSQFFVNVQQALTALISASASAEYDPAVLDGRRSLSVPNANEDTLRLGLALTWQPTKNWSFSATFDHDHVRSDVAARELKRDRTGLDATYSF